MTIVQAELMFADSIKSTEAWVGVLSPESWV